MKSTTSNLSDDDDRNWISITFPVRTTKRQAFRNAYTQRCVGLTCVLVVSWTTAFRKFNFVSALPILTIYLQDRPSLCASSTLRIEYKSLIDWLICEIQAAPSGDNIVNNLQLGSPPNLPLSSLVFLFQSPSFNVLVILYPLVLPLFSAICNFSFRSVSVSTKHIIMAI